MEEDWSRNIHHGGLLRTLKGRSGKRSETCFSAKSELDSSINILFPPKIVTVHTLSFA